MLGPRYVLESLSQGRLSPVVKPSHQAHTPQQPVPQPSPAPRSLATTSPAKPFSSLGLSTTPWAPCSPGFRSPPTTCDGRAPLNAVFASSSFSPGRREIPGCLKQAFGHCLPPRSCVAINSRYKSLNYCFRSINRMPMGRWQQMPSANAGQASG